MEIQNPSLDVDEDILMVEILPRLPIKSLFRFKSVCKEWRNLISNDPIFFTNHYQYQTISSAMICKPILRNLEFISTSIEAEPKLSLVGVPDPSMSYIATPRQTSASSLLASTNGLLCFYPYEFREESKFYVCNPVTQDCTYIRNPEDRGLAGLAFDPLLSSHFQLICPYKTHGPYSLQIHHPHIESELRFQVFSSKNCVWRVSKAKLVLSFNQHLLYGSLSIFNGGKLYWRVNKDIIWFDPSEDRAGLLFSPPDDEKIKYPKVEIGEFNGGGLSYAKITDKHIEIWVIREDSNGSFQFQWTKRYCVNWGQIFQHNQKVVASSYNKKKKLKTREALDILACRHEAIPLPFGGGEVLCILVPEIRMGYCRGNILKYNLRTGEIEICHGLVMENYFLYKASLFPLPKSTDFHVKS